MGGTKFKVSEASAQELETEAQRASMLEESLMQGSGELPMVEKATSEVQPGP